VRPVVLDASLALAVVLPDESSRSAEKLLSEVSTGRVELLSSSFWNLEVTNAIHQAFRRKRISGPDRLEYLGVLMRLPIRIVESELDAAALFAIADADDLSIYDAAYLALAVEEDALLATEDTVLLRAAKRRGIEWTA
jgi:predicted nucleic acid-binding protein